MVNVIVETKIVAFCKKAIWFLIYGCFTVMAIICFSRSEIGQGLAWSVAIVNMILFFPQMFKSNHIDG